MLKIHVSVSLITQRSQVQILPRYFVKPQVRGPFAKFGGRVFGVGCQQYVCGHCLRSAPNGARMRRMTKPGEAWRKIGASDLWAVTQRSPGLAAHARSSRRRVHAAPAGWRKQGRRGVQIRGRQVPSIANLVPLRLWGVVLLQLPHRQTGTPGPEPHLRVVGDDSDVAPD